MKNYFRIGSIILIVVAIFMVVIACGLVYAIFTVDNILLAVIMGFGAFLFIGTGVFSFCIGQMFWREAATEE